MNIIDIQQGAVRATYVDIVDINADPGIDIDAGIALADTADIDIRQWRIAVSRLHLDIRCNRVQVRQVAYPRFAQGIRTQGGYRQRGFLQAFFAFTRGYDDFFEYIFLGIHRLCGEGDKCTGNSCGQY